VPRGAGAADERGRRGSSETARAGLVILLEGRGKKAVWGPGPGEMTATRMKRPAVAPPSAPVPDVEALIVRMLAADDTKLERIERILGAVA